VCCASLGEDAGDCQSALVVVGIHPGMFPFFWLPTRKEECYPSIHTYRSNTMPDCYDTRYLTQSMIDAIMEIWDTAEIDSRQVTSTENGAHDDTVEVFLAGEQSERRRYALLV
jgi:hypothetical protein